MAVGDRVVHIRGGRFEQPPGAPVSEPPSRFESLLDLSRDAFVETDGYGVVTEWNRRAELVFGWSRDEVIGRNAEDFLIPGRFARRYSADLEAARAMGGAERTRPRELQLLHREGHELHVASTAYVIADDDEIRVGGFVREIGSEAAAEEALAHAYLHDSLTGLPNRTLFTYRLAYALAKTRAVPGNVSVIVLDLDRFKAINDALGHEVGDEVLVVVAGRLVTAGGAPEVVARLGGDEFLVLFDGPQSERQALQFSERVLDALAEPIQVGRGEVFISASIGMATTGAGVTEPTPLLSNADAAMYQAKRGGGRRIEVFGEALRVHVIDRMNTEHSLHRALERRELRLYYQPVVELAGTDLVSSEALLRWEHPDQGLVGPDRFVPVAEESGLIIPIGAWVLREACDQLRAWQGAGWRGPLGGIEVNLSARQVEHPKIVETVEHILSDTGVSPDRLTLEITESALMQDARSALGVLRALKDLGVTLAIDDFGTGYSSLGYLQRFPLDVLKIDKGFVDGLGTDPGGAEIVSAVIGLAHALGLQVIAEGVENELQLEELRRLGCDYAQGFLFSRPVPADQLAATFAPRTQAPALHHSAAAS
ncbi:MAG: putative bifunctional diguanylate cyclase/phosphodiesterase [Acidimicrobiales bacterium]